MFCRSAVAASLFRVIASQLEDTSGLLQRALDAESADAQGLMHLDAMLEVGESGGEELGCSTAGLMDAGMRIITPHSVTYDDDRAQWASMMGSREESDNALHPHLIIFCSTEEDVVRAVNFAKMCGCQISVRSGGHQYAGASSCEKGKSCVQLDVSNLETFDYKEATNEMILGVGLNLEQVWKELVPRGLTLPTGVCNTVNIGGHLQSSALGSQSRSEGLGLDHVKSFRIVLADGSVHTVSPDSSLGCSQDPCAAGEKNLFWAVLGGGPGSWGVVLDYTVTPVRDSKYPHSTMVKYAWIYRPDVWVAMSKKFFDVMKNPKFERDFMAVLKVAILPQLMCPPGITPEMAAQATGTPCVPDAVHKGNPKMHYILFQGLWTGGDNGAFTDAIKAEVVDSITSVADSMQWPTLVGKVIPAPQSILIQSSHTNFDQLPGHRYHIHGFSHEKIMDDQFIEKTAEEINKRIALGMYSNFDWLPFGGAQHHGGQGAQMNRNGDGRNAFALRHMSMHVDDWVFFEEGDENAAKAKSLVHDFRASTKSFWDDETDSAVQLFMTPDSTKGKPEYGKLEAFAHYFPSMDQMCDLVRVKTSVDPDDVFHSPLTIPSNASGHLFLHCD